MNINRINKKSNKIGGRRYVALPEGGHVAFQPIWNINDNSILGYEALYRCPGSQSPEPLIRRAVENNCITELDEGIHDLAIRSIGNHYKQHLFLNCHPFSLKEILMMNVDKYYSFSGQLVFEITEIERLSKETIKDFCKQARDLGILIALDDFGAGYNNVSILDIIKPSFIKLDKSIISDLDRSIVQKYVGIIKEWCADNKALIIGEGVECKKHLFFCKSNEISFAQGFFLGRPKEMKFESSLSY